MAGPPGTPTDRLSLFAALEAEPYRFGFFEALRRLECAHRDRPNVGESHRPAEDPVRLGQQPSMVFAPSTLAAFHPGKGGRPPRLEVHFLGLFGPNGPLPLHLTEYARDRMRNANDATFARFADMFHHRMLSLFYRAFARASPVINFDRPENDRYSTYIGSLMGIGRPALRNRDAVADVAKLYYAGRFSAQTKNAEGLREVLRDFFKVPVAIQEFVGEWIDVPSAGLCRLGANPETSRLGLNVIVGARIWEGQQKFRIVFGPVSYKDFQRLLPGGDSLRRLVALVRNYIGDELNWDLNLILLKEEVPPLALGEHVRLGWSTWLTGPPRATDAADLHLNPLACAG